MTTAPIGPARLVRIPLEGSTDPVAAARWLRSDPRPVALAGAWAGGGALLSSHPVAIADPGEDPFALLDAQPAVTYAAGADRDGAVGGGWLGWLGFGLGRMLEPVPPPPPRPAPLPPFDLAFHDHVVRLDADGRWWFEALWTDARADLLRARLQTWRERLGGPLAAPAPHAAGPLRPCPPGADGHAAAVAEGVERIAAGEVFQVNLCLRLDGRLDGDLLDLWVQAAGELRPAYAAYVGGGGHAVASLSPELFLRREGRSVVTEPIKGTAPLSVDPAVLVASVKDRAENVMIVDLMRNDLGRVCTYGTVSVERLFEVRRAAGVWHLVSTVRGELRPGASDGDLLRATFPPGSVTGAPKVRALRVISELEGTAREAYCGAAGVCSPVSGLEMSVAIRTFEARGDVFWLGAGGGVVADSDPSGEVDEALAKARGVATAAGVEIRSPRPSAAATSSALRAVTPPRPDPAHGVLETLRVEGGVAAEAGAHLARLTASCAVLGLALADDLASRLAGVAADLGTGRLRVHVDGRGAHITTGPLPEAGGEPVRLRPVLLPGGLGAHKWADRRLIDALSEPGVTPLFCDLDGAVLEAGYAAIALREGGVLAVPPADGRILPSVSRARLLAAELDAGRTVSVEPLTLDRVRSADVVLLTSSLRGPHPAVLLDERLVAVG